MTDAQIREIRERCEAATPGPWVYPGGAIVRAPENHGTRAVHSDAVCDAFVSNRGNAEASANVAFIAHSRTDIPALLAELDRLRAELEAAKEPEHTKPKTGLCYMCKYAYDGGMRCKIPKKERGEPFCTRWERGGPVAENTPAPEMGV